MLTFLLTASLKTGAFFFFFKNLKPEEGISGIYDIFYLMYAIPFHHAYIHILQIYIHENAQEAPNHVSSGCDL